MLVSMRVVERRAVCRAAVCELRFMRAVGCLV